MLCCMNIQENEEAASTASLPQMRTQAQTSNSAVDHANTGEMDFIAVLSDRRRFEPSMSTN